MVGVPPRFWAPTEGTSSAARPSTNNSPASSREVRMASAPFEQIVGGRDGRVEGVHGAVALAHERGARELVVVAVGVELRQLTRALEARERRDRQREGVREPIAARVAERPEQARESPEAAVCRPDLAGWRRGIDARN